MKEKEEEILLNERQRKFCDEYLKTGVAYSAAINAGYSETYARSDSHKLLANTRIRQYLDKRLTVLKDKDVADQEEVLRFLTDSMRGKFKQEQVLIVPTGEGRGQIEKVYLAAKLSDRLKAGELLGKVHGLFTERVENINKNIEIELGVWEEEED